MLYREIIAVCSENHTNRTNTLCGQNVGLLNPKPWQCTTQSNHRGFKEVKQYLLNHAVYIKLHSAELYDQ